jgi:hemin uptake protein HemP
MMENKQTRFETTAPELPKRCAPQANRVSSRELLGEAGELIIEHKGRSYRLRVTRQGNLILTA